jgi:hydrogenase/urease accessory protein HupE
MNLSLIKSQIKELVKRPFLLGMTILFSIVVTALPSHAHWADLAVGEISIEAQSAKLILTIPTQLVEFADRDQDGKLTVNEVSENNLELKEFFTERLHFVNQKAESGELEITAVDQVENPVGAPETTHSTLNLNYRWQQPLEDLSLRYDLFIPGVSTARCLINISHEGRLQSLVLTPLDQNISLMQRPLLQQINSFLILGVEHILTGYDHILFLISLLLVSNNLKYLLKIVTAFTISHSITLSLATLNIFTLPAQLVESAIALSIVYVALENTWRREFRHRWMLTFAFGLIHGMGFAGILQEFSLSKTNLAISLVSFNLGVELGQIGIITACFLTASQLAKIPLLRQWQPKTIVWGSLAIAAVGSIWFVQRAFLGL